MGNIPNADMEDRKISFWWGLPVNDRMIGSCQGKKTWVEGRVGIGWSEFNIKLSGICGVLPNLPAMFNCLTWILIDNRLERPVISVCRNCG